ncbi:MAG: class F sortase [Candidatus Paceibacterota bacterium]|jgi:LPXTG-site transpeptidase (sortase) family protein
MKSKKFSGWTLLLFFAIGFILPTILSLYVSPRRLAATGPISLVENAAASQIPAISGLPSHLRIPAIDVDSIVEYVSLTIDGVMDIPEDPADVGWFEPGPRPGGEGSAVIAGHYGWKDGIPAVFDNLNKLRRGDKIYVEDDTGTVITFIVRELKVYGKDDDASDVFRSNDGIAHLNLITCEGVWNKALQGYSQRLVVFTDRQAD